MHHYHFKRLCNTVVFGHYSPEGRTWYVTEYHEQPLWWRYFPAVSVAERRVPSPFLQTAWPAAPAPLPTALCSAALAVFDVQPQRQRRVVLSQCTCISTAPMRNTAGNSDSKLPFKVPASFCSTEPAEMNPTLKAVIFVQAEKGLSLAPFLQHWLQAKSSWNGVRRRWCLCCKQLDAGKAVTTGS